jgi:plasmid maintenance system antidote protein VapI
MNSLKLLVERALAMENLSVRAAAFKFGVSHTTIHRILNNEPADLDTIIKICKVLGVEPATVLNAEASTDKQSVVSIIATIVEVEPRLASLFADLAHDLQEGTVSSDDVADIVSYASYRLSKNANRQNVGVQAKD